MVPAPIVLGEVFADPGALAARIGERGPYWNQARYIPAGRAAAATAPPGHPLARADGSAPPVFREDWAYFGPLVEGVEYLLDHGPFVDAARALFGGDVIVPYVVHVNLTAPGPAIDAGHTDVPVFRGLDRRNAPGWLLLAMVRSGLFGRWSVATATAVAWLYRGQGGEFTYWPHGPDRPAECHGDLWNTAIIGDNDRMFHRVEAVGGPDRRDLRLSSDSQLRRRPDGRFEIVDHGRPVVEMGPAELRISISWKAMVFSADDHALYAEGTDDIEVDQVRRILLEALAEAGSVLDPTTEIGDPAFVEAVAGRWPRNVPAIA